MILSNLALRFFLQSIKLDFLVVNNINLLIFLSIYKKNTLDSLYIFKIFEN